MSRSLLNDKFHAVALPGHFALLKEFLYLNQGSKDRGGRMLYRL